MGETDLGDEADALTDMGTEEESCDDLCWDCPEADCGGCPCEGPGARATAPGRRQ
jgi:hypothetical protein